VHSRVIASSNTYEVAAFARSGTPGKICKLLIIWKAKVFDYRVRVTEDDRALSRRLQFFFRKQELRTALIPFDTIRCTGCQRSEEGN